MPDWVWGVIGLSGVTIVAVLGAIFNRPKIAFRFYIDKTGSGQMLFCRLWNVPFRNAVMFLFSMTRPQINVSVQCEILDKENQTAIHKPFWVDMADINFKGVFSKNISMPAQVTPAIFTIIHLIKGKACPADAKVGEYAIPSGFYIIRLTALYGHYKSIAEQELVVADKLILGERIK